jgi:hypothetical protein
MDHAASSSQGLRKRFIVFHGFRVKNQPPSLPEEKICCGYKAHHICVLKTSSSTVNGNTRWDADGPNGPDTEPKSKSVLLNWWTTESKISKHREGKEKMGKTKEAYRQRLSTQ